MSKPVSKLLLLACLATAAVLWSGCSKTGGARRPVQPAPVSAAQVQDAVRQVQRMRADAGAQGQDEFETDLAVLTRFPHRLAGYGSESANRAKDVPGSIYAARYVEARLKAIGIEQVFTQDFPVVQPVSTECSLFVDGQEVKEPDGSPVIYPARPNLLQASITPAEGLAGATVWAGKGLPTQYPELPEGKIVLLDIDCGKDWLTAFSMGAKAVIFVGDEAPASKATQHINMPANLPRFYISRQTAQRLKLTEGSRQVTIKAACEWRGLNGRNVIAVVRGSAPRFGKPYNGQPQAIVLAAPLDSLSEVPDLSPGARDAANVAGLLQLAEHFHKNPVPRDMILCFFDGQTLNHLGARAFYGALYRKPVKGSQLTSATLEDRLVRLEDELGVVSGYEQVAGSADIFAPELKARPDFEDLMRVLRTQTRVMSTAVQTELRKARLARRDLASAGKPVPDSLNASIDYLGKVSFAWNAVQRILHNKRFEIDPAAQENSHDPEFAQRVRAAFDSLLDESRLLLKLRREEITTEIDQVNQGRVLQAAIGAPDPQAGVSGNVIMMHIALNLGDARNRWSFIHGDDSEVRADDTTYKETYAALRAAAQAAGEAAGSFDPAPISDKIQTRLFAPAMFVDSGGVARIFGYDNLSIMTVLDPLSRQGQPSDTIAAMGAAGVENVRDQLAGAKAVLGELAASTSIYQESPRRAATAHIDEDSWNNGRASGPAVMKVGVGSAMPDLPVRGAVVAICRGVDWTLGEVDRTPPGFTYPLLCRTDMSGIYRVGPYSTENLKDVQIIAATFDQPLPEHVARGPASRPAATAATSGSRGLIAEISTQLSAKGKTPLAQSKAVLFRSRLKTVVGYGFDRGSIKTLPMPGTSSARMRDDRHLLCELENVATLFAIEEIQAVKLFNKAGLVLLNNGPDKKDDARSEGIGLPLDDPFDHPVSVVQTARDIQNLNKSRQDVLRNNRINQDSLDDLTESALYAYYQSQLPDRTVDGRLGDTAAAAALSRRVYIPLINVMNDLVAAVVLLLLLAIPFGYALERLIIGTPHIYRQIGWFAVFFLLTFGVLFAVNPAFSIAATPIIIFLAFAIILLSALVIFIMMRKLQTEVRRMQGLASTVHNTDVSRLSTMMAAVNMGISTMRRRPLRTLLTAVTVVLLTFTILTFASFGSSWDNRRTYQGPMQSSVPHIMVRHQLWNAIGQGVHHMLRGSLEADATVVPRYWVSPLASEMAAVKAGSTEMLLSSPDASLTATISAAIGIDVRDVQRQKDLAAVLKGDAELLKSDGIFLSQAVAGTSGLRLTNPEIGKTKVLLAGREFTFAGFIDDAASNFYSIEGSQMLPVKYEEGGITDTRTAEQTQSEAPDIESAQFMTYSVDQVVVMSADRARQMRLGRIRSLTVYPNDPEQIESLARRCASLSELPTYVSERDGGVYRLIFTSLASASGVKDLMIPVLLGGLIVFATMLGSVSDREREIYTFSSLGLAPPHVASLFFAEASMYAVIGGMGGYLLGQVIARLLAALGLGLQLNYSSTNAIVTVLIVMFTVMVSAAYPAIKASRSANPGIQRAWRIPKPDGNLYELVFPFTVSAYDITGVVGFLREHFLNYSDASLGVFATTRCHIFRQQSNNMLGFRAQVALAPFDLGVNQDFALLSQPSDIEGIDEVRILIRRLSGAHGDWQRANRVFINDLRKQLLIWRSLKPEVCEHYRRQTLEAWNSLPVEQVDAQSMGGNQ
jgi:hypothetical protein